MLYQIRTARRPPKGPKNAVFDPGDFYLWPGPSNLSKRGNKHVFRVNLTQIRSAVPDIVYFIHKQKTQTDGAKNRTFRSSLRAVMNSNSTTGSGPLQCKLN